MKSIVALSIAVACSQTSAQTTSTLGHVERAWPVQITGAVSSPFVDPSYGSRAGSLLALDVTTEHELGGLMRVRIDAWAVRRQPHSSYAIEYTYDAQLLRGYSRDMVDAWFVAGVLSGEFPIHLPNDVVIAPMMGLGAAPYARVRAIERSTNPDAYPSRPAQATGKGYVAAVGVSVRWGHLVIEQHVLQVMGADGVLGNGENAPLAVGLRF
jgi:hypothetical protein